MYLYSYCTKPIDSLVTAVVKALTSSFQWFDVTKLTFGRWPLFSVHSHIQIVLFHAVTSDHQPYFSSISEPIWPLTACFKLLWLLTIDWLWLQLKLSIQSCCTSHKLLVYQARNFWSPRSDTLYQHVKLPHTWGLMVDIRTSQVSLQHSYCWFRSRAHTCITVLVQ